MNVKTLKIYFQLFWHFKNGIDLIRGLRGGLNPPLALPRRGPPITHPLNQSGLVEVLTEIWCEDDYFQDGYRLPAAAVVIDVGANIGAFALWCHKKSQTARIICLEPAQLNFECLTTNLSSLVKQGKVELYKLAIGASSGTRAIKYYPTRSLDVRISDDSSDSLETIKVIRIDQLLDLAKTESVDLLKIDIEGAEKECFESTPKEQFLAFKRIVIEYHENIHSGILTIINDRLRDSHVLDLRPSTLPGCGLIIASRR